METTDRKEPRGRHLTLGPEHVWPLIIVVLLAVVLVVNAIFIWIAVTGADDVAPSYTESER